MHNSSGNAYFSAPIPFAPALSFAFMTLLSSSKLLAACVPVRQRGRRVRVGGGARGRHDLPGDIYFRIHGPAH